MAYILHPLPYAYGDLEPHIDAKTMEIHHSKHHQAYLDKLNTALENHPVFFENSIEDLLKKPDTLPKDIVDAVRNNGGGYYHHSIFWEMMSPEGGGSPKGALLEGIKDKFGEFSVFKDKFNHAATSLFGSGWAWLVKDADNNLSIIKTPNQDSPVSQGLIPLLGIDVWEHAYYLKYQNRRAEYIEAWWNVVNWEQVDKNFQG